MSGRNPVRISAEIWAGLLREYSCRIEVNGTSFEASEKHFDGGREKELRFAGFSGFAPSCL
jgi:hypothetical protein